MVIVYDQPWSGHVLTMISLWFNMDGNHCRPLIEITIVDHFLPMGDHG